MGEGQSKQAPQAYVQNFEAGHQLVQPEFDDVRMGRLAIWQGPEGYVAVKKSFVQGKDDVNFSIANVDTIINTLSQSPYLLKLYSFNEQTQQAMCGSTQEVTTYHEFYLNNLEAEIQQRVQNNVYYQESELWIILYSIVNAAAFLEGHNKIINDVRPSNVYVTENGQLKLQPFGCYPDDMSAYAKTQTFNVQCFLPPEQLQSIAQGQQQPTTNAYKADTFAIGMTLLACATLQSSTKCFNYQNFTINEEVLNQQLQRAQQMYPKFFVNLIKLMINSSETVRPTSKAILQILQPYEFQILNLQKFQPNYQVIRQSIQSADQSGLVPQYKTSGFTSQNRSLQFPFQQSQPLQQSPKPNLYTSTYRPEVSQQQQQQFRTSTQQLPPQFTQSQPNQVQQLGLQTQQQPPQFQPQGLQTKSQPPQVQQGQQGQSFIPQQPIQQLSPAQFQVPYIQQSQQFQPQQIPSQFRQSSQPPVQSQQFPPQFNKTQQPPQQRQFQPQFSTNQSFGQPQQPWQQQTQQPQQIGQYDRPQLQNGQNDQQNDLNEIDKRINEVLNRTKSAMERAGQLENQ